MTIITMRIQALWGSPSVNDKEMKIISMTIVVPRSGCLKRRIKGSKTMMTKTLSNEIVPKGPCISL